MTDRAQVTVRRAHRAEAGELSVVARAAKASWGYPPAWLREWEPQLTFTPEYVASMHVFVAEVDGGVAGVVALGNGDDPEIEHLWVAPAHQGRGIGRALLERAMSVARERGWRALRIESDPQAEPFYTRFGARRIGDVDAPVAGTARRLPLLTLEL